MTRRRFPRSSLAPSLFPFLAVLICTMGALIALLVLGVQQAHVHAEVVAEEQQTQLQASREVQEAKQLEVEDLQWQQDVLEQQREAKHAQFSEQRLQLSHLEVHLRQLRDDWQRLRAKLQELDEVDQRQGRQAEQWEDQLRDLEKEIERSQEQLDDVREKVKQQNKGYAVVVYEGNQGTKRRPIYLECTAEGIEIHPGGILITDKDLAGPGGPGNPLDACLRTVREYLVRQGLDEVEPYPLLLVRPGAIYTYGLARDAMKSWQDEFGYELIEESVSLEFSETDTELQRLLLQTIQEARERQRSLAKAMPSRFGNQQLGHYRMANSQVQAVNRGSLPNPASGRGFGKGDAGGAGRNPDFQQGSTVGETVENTAGQLVKEQQESTGRAASKPGQGGGEGGTVLESRPQHPGWGLPKRPAGATGVSRPVRVICTTDRLIIVPGRYEQLAPLTTQTGGDVAGSLDHFVAALWQYMENWGIAVAGGYWKPVLKVEVRPGASSHFDKLKALLESSGIEVQRK